MRNAKPEPTIPVDNVADDAPIVWHFHVSRFGPGEHAESNPVCHGEDREAARRGYIVLLNLLRTELKPCTAPGDNGRCPRDDCWTCTSHELIDQAIANARTTPPEHLHNLGYTYGPPLGPRHHHTINTLSAKYCRAS